MTTFSKQDEITFDEFYLNLLKAIKTELKHRAKTYDDDILSGHTVQLIADDTNNDRRRLELIAGKESTRIEFTRASRSYFYRGDRQMERAVKVTYEGWKTKSFPLLKAGGFNYKLMAKRAIEEVASSMYRTRRSTAKASGYTKSSNAIERLNARFEKNGLKSYKLDSNDNGKVGLKMQLTEKQMEVVLNAMSIGGIDLSEI